MCTDYLENVNTMSFTDLMIFCKLLIRVLQFKSVKSWSFSLKVSLMRLFIITFLFGHTVGLCCSFVIIREMSPTFNQWYIFVPNHLKVPHSSLVLAFYQQNVLTWLQEIFKIGNQLEILLTKQYEYLILSTCIVIILAF